jgi:transposase-like protein
MAKNKIQFQKGMSLANFMQQYGTEAKCSDALFKLRWPDGFSCPYCGNATYCVIRKRNLFQCNRCHSQTSLTAGTIFHSTNLPLSTWFLTMFLMTQSKNGISLMELSRHIGTSYNAAWRIKHKLMQAMLERDSKKSISGYITIDDAYLGGKKKPGKRGRGAQGKTAFVAAVESHDNKPYLVKLSKVNGFRSREIRRWSGHHLKPPCSDESRKHSE